MGEKSVGLGDWYDAHVLPRLVTCGCSQKAVMDRRAQIVPLARGDVFELGCGGGLNQPLFEAAAITSYSGIDPHGGLLDAARAAASAKGWAANIREGVGEAIPFSDRSFDSVVCTFTLCSVEDPGRVLAELRRILRPGGRALFLEHGRAPDPAVVRWQTRVEPVWKRIAGGCHLTRPIGSAFRGSGFEVEPLGQGYMPKAPRIAGWTEWGMARKPGV